MRTPLLAILVLMGTSLQAQFVYHPIPFGAGEFRNISKGKQKKCLIYQLDQGLKALKYEIEFDNKGLPVAVNEKGTDENGDSASIATTFYTYDSKGRLTRRVDEDMEYGQTFVFYGYDADGRLLEKKIVSIDPPTYTYFYDAKGRLTTATIFQRFPEVDADGEPTGRALDRLTSKSTFACNDKGVLTREMVYGDDGTLQFSWEWTYDERGRVIKLVRSDAEGNLMHEWQYEYNAAGLPSRVSEKDHYDDPEESVYEYED